MTAAGAEAGSDLAPVNPATSGSAVPANAEHRDGRAVAVPARRRLVRSVVCFLSAILSALAAWFLLRHGIRTDEFPSFIAGEQSTPITRYSGPWVTAAAGMALVAALFLMFAVIDLLRWSQAKRERR